MKRVESIALTAIALTTALTSYSPAIAEEISCQGTLGAIAVDNVRVPSGKTCNLNGTQVKGTIKVESNAVLNANQVNVVGNIQAENASAVNVISNSTIGGSIQIKQGKQAKIFSSRIDGDLQFESNNRSLSAENNEETQPQQAAGYL